MFFLDFIYYLRSGGGVLKLGVIFLNSLYVDLGWYWFYRYYEGGVFLVYVWEFEDGKGFVVCVLIKKGIYFDFILNFYVV